MSSRAPSLAPATLALSLAAVVTIETAPVPAQAKLLAFDAQAKALLATMPLPEKGGRMTTPAQFFIKDRADIEKYFFGSVLSGGDSDPKTNTVEDWGATYEDIQAHALKTR